MEVTKKVISEVTERLGRVLGKLITTCNKVNDKEIRCVVYRYSDGKVEKIGERVYIGLDIVTVARIIRDNIGREINDYLRRVSENVRSG